MSVVTWDSSPKPVSTEKTQVKMKRNLLQKPRKAPSLVALMTVIIGQTNPWVEGPYLLKTVRMYGAQISR